MLQEKVQAFTRETGAVGRGSALLVGVSGGADSVGLLHALWSLAPSLGVSLHVAHLNHGLRGQDAIEDARFVAELARGWGLPATIAAADVRRYGQERRLAIEVAAREVRYAFFADLVGRIGAAGVAVGHTADDQVETLLLHFLRGAGLAGLRGMSPVQRLTVRDPAQWRERWATNAAERVELDVLRPLLGATRAEVEGYLARHGLPYRHDASNEELAFTRNRIRHELVPVLETYNPAFRQTALRTAHLLADDHAYLAQAAAEAWDRVARVEATGLALDRAVFVALAPALRRLLVRRAFAALAGDTIDLGFVHVEDVVALAERGRTGAAVDLPSGLRALKTYGKIIFTRATPGAAALPAEGVTLVVPGETVVEPGDWIVEAEVRSEPCAETAEDRWHADFDLDRAGEGIVVRRRRPGDRLRLPGLGGSKKLQDLFVDRRVPRWERDAVPIVASRAFVLWAVGHASDERAHVSEDTTRVLCLRFRKREAT